MKPDRFTGGNDLEDALRRIRDVVQDGLRHGHFCYKITCEMTNGSKRQLTIGAGKSYRYVIPKEALPN